MAQRRAHGEGSIYYEDSRDRWVGEVNFGPDPVTGKRRRRRVTDTTRKAVAAKLAQIIDDQRAGLTVSTRATVSELYEPWIERKAEAVSASTTKMYRDLWAGHLEPVFGARSVDQITVAEVEAFLAGRRHLATATLRKIRGLLAQVIDEAVRHRTVGFNAARLAVLPAGTKPARDQRALTAEEAGALLTAADGERLEAWLLVALHTGARPGELAALEWDDLDLDEGVMRIAASKTGTYRTVRLPDHVTEALREHRTVRTAEDTTMTGIWPESALVFVSEAGTPLDTANLRRFLVRMSRDAELDWTPTPYTMRHTHASILSASGVHAEALAQRLGHKDSRTTTAYYIHPVTPVVEAGADLDLRAV